MDYVNIVWYAFNGGHGEALNAPWERWREILGLGSSIHLEFSQHFFLLSDLVRDEGKWF